MTPDSGGAITTERREHLLLIGIDRAAKLNSFTPDMFRALSDGYGVLDRDPDLRCGVVFGHGRNFTAGLDLPKFTAIMQQGERIIPAGAIDPFRLNPPFCRKPVVFAVKGWCLTLGIELMLAADIVIAASDARFGQIEIKRGIMPTGGALIRMVERAGWGNAMRYLLTGDEFDAHTAHRLGMVQEVVLPGEELDRALALAGRIAEQAPLAVQASLASSRLYAEQGPAAAIAEYERVQKGLAATADAAEGVRAFRERRRPQFSGR
jgi:enoyl-CoA hydratase